MDHRTPPLRGFPLLAGLLAGSLVFMLPSFAEQAGVPHPSALARVTALDRPVTFTETKIPLGEVSGRIDHLAIDLPRRRLFVAELGNDSVAVVDLNERKVRHVITGLKEPQGVGYVPTTEMLFVTNAGDGSVRLFRGTDYDSAGRIHLGQRPVQQRQSAAGHGGHRQ